MKVAITMETEFHELHGNSLSNEALLFDTLVHRTIAKLPHLDISDEVINCLARTRTFIRLHELNKKISFKNCQRKLNRKMSKFTNVKK